MLFSLNFASIKFRHFRYVGKITYIILTKYGSEFRNAKLRAVFIFLYHENLGYKGMLSVAYILQIAMYLFV